MSWVDFDEYMKEKMWRQKFNILRNALLLFLGFMYSGHNVLLTGFKFSLLIYTMKIFAPVLRRMKKSTDFNITPQIRQLYVVTDYGQSTDTDNKL